MTQQLLLKPLTLFILFSFSYSIFIPDINNDYYPYTDETGLAGDKNSPVNPACANAIANANRAMTKLVQDLKAQSFQWNLYSEFDAVDEVSYYLKTRCKTKYLDLINVGKTGLNATQDRACEKLMGMFVSLLEKRQAASFRGAFEGGINIVAKGKRLGRFLGDNCKPVLVARKANETDGSLAESVKNVTNSAIAGSILALKTNLRIGANYEKEGIDMIIGDDHDVNKAMFLVIESEGIL